MSVSAVSVAQYAPNFRIVVEGTDLPREATNMVVSVSVVQAHNQASSFSIELQDQELQGRFRWLGGAAAATGAGGQPLIDIGHRVSIAMGYADRLEPVLEGTIQGLSANFTDGIAPSISITGADPAFDGMTQRREAETFRNMTDGDIVGQIARAVSLRADVTATRIVHPEKTMNGGSSYLEFVEQLAADNGYVFGFSGTEFVFRPKPRGGGRLPVFTWGRDLLSAAAEVDARQQPAEVTVRARHPTEGRDIEVTVRAGDEQPQDPGRRSGSEVARDNKSARPTCVITNRPVRSEEEARLIATSELQRRSDKVLKVTGEVVGGLSLRPAMGIELKGLGRWFDTIYVLRRVTHSISAGGFRSRFEAESNAVPPSASAGLGG